MHGDSDDDSDEFAPDFSRNSVSTLFSPARYPHPFSMFHDKPSVTEGRSTDRLGFCNLSAPVLPKPPNEKRVFLFGNSAVRHGGFKNSISAMLQNSFHERGRRDVKVYNMGIASAVNMQFLTYLVHEGIELAPDLVMTYDGFVELAIPFMYDPRPGYTYNHYMLELVHEHVGAGTLQTFRLPDLEADRRALLRKQAGFLGDEWKGGLLAAYERALLRIHELGSFYGIRTYSCLQPIVYEKALKAGREAIYDSQSRIGRCTIEMFERARNRRKVWQSRFDARHNRFGDLSQLFDGDPEERFADMAHMKFEAHVPIAARLYDEIEGLI